MIDAGPFRLVALTDLSNTSTPHTGRITREALAGLPSPAGDMRPLFAFLHWGIEFQREASARQVELMDWLSECPVSAVFGAHPHIHSGGAELWRDGVVCRSLGNFLFDQSTGSGALAEVRFFENQTFAVRWIPLGNLLYTPLPESATEPR